MTVRTSPMSERIPAQRAPLQQMPQQGTRPAAAQRRRRRPAYQSRQMRRMAARPRRMGPEEARGASARAVVTGRGTEDRRPDRAGARAARRRRRPRTRPTSTRTATSTSTGPCWPTRCAPLGAVGCPAARSGCRCSMGHALLRLPMRGLEGRGCPCAASRSRPIGRLLARCA